jgi:hypothetical protein
MYAQGDVIVHKIELLILGKGKAKQFLSPI